MFRRALFSAIAVAAGTAAALLIRVLSEKEKPLEKEEEGDDEIHFVSIKNDDIPEAVQEVCAVYPYLDAGFVEEELSKSAELNRKYPEDTLVEVSHQVSFSSKELGAVFTDIMEPAGYACEGEEAVKASRKFFTVEGAVLSDVLNVANQAKALKGEYLGYTISEVSE